MVLAEKEQDVIGKELNVKVTPQTFKTVAEI